MNLKHLPSGAGLAALALAASMTVPAGAADEPHASAIKACSSASAHGPAAVVTAIDDGRGGSLVWLTDANANLWLCSADTDGHIYAYPMITGDLLNGAGADLVNIDRPPMTAPCPHPSTTRSTWLSVPARPPSQRAPAKWSAAVKTVSREIGSPAISSSSATRSASVIR